MFGRPPRGLAFPRRSSSCAALVFAGEHENLLRPSRRDTDEIQARRNIGSETDFRAGPF